MQIKNRQNEIISDMFAEYQICMEMSIQENGNIIIRIRQTFGNVYI